MYYFNTNSVMFISKIPSTNNLNGPLRGYRIEYKEEGKPSWTTVNVSDSSTDKTLQNLKKWTVYFIRIAVSNGDFLGLPGPEKQVRTLEDVSTSSNPNLSSHEVLSKEATVALSVVGAILFLCIVLGFAFFCFIRHQRKQIVEYRNQLFPVYTGKQQVKYHVKRA
ncbi:Down syndrome cell adhesion molecule-like protein 1 [Porites harrisoni]